MLYRTSVPFTEESSLGHYSYHARDHKPRLKVLRLLSDTELKVKGVLHLFLFRCDGQCGAWTGPCTLLPQQQGHSVYRGDSLGTVPRDFLNQVFTINISKTVKRTIFLSLKSSQPTKVPCQLLKQTVFPSLLLFFSLYSRLKLFLY
jgi:hypothetical protein